MTLERSPSSLLQAGVQAHKLGDLKSAEELYQKALSRYGNEESYGDLKDADVAELLHLLGALKVQKLLGDDDDDDHVAPSSAVQGLDAAVQLLRKSLLLLPSDAGNAARARIVCSLGTALLHAPERKRLGDSGSGLGRSKGVNLEEAVEFLREACTLNGQRWAAWYNVARALSLLLQEREECKSSAGEVKALE